ncbi:hypothetical protein HanPI659440_Chr00c07g0717711 [Helianthus annuus]|nr:hypothetical protein HanPI659440_Chr00c07g0717711 [Helianthus annuus]
MVGDAAMRDPSRSYYGRQTFWIRELKTSGIVLCFWRPLDDGGGGRLVLEANRNPYAVSPYNRRLQDKYRVSSAKYLFSIDERDNNPAWIITGGPVVTAFLNRFPEVVLDMRDHQGSPLAVCGLECDLKCCVMLPVFHSASSECVGVVECSMKHPALLLPIFIELKRELERVSLSIYHVQGSWPYKVNKPKRIECMYVCMYVCMFLNGLFV